MWKRMKSKIKAKSGASPAAGGGDGGDGDSPPPSPAPSPVAASTEKETAPEPAPVAAPAPRSPSEEGRLHDGKPVGSAVAAEGAPGPASLEDPERDKGARLAQANALAEALEAELEEDRREAAEEAGRHLETPQGTIAPGAPPTPLTASTEVAAQGEESPEVGEAAPAARFGGAAKVATSVAAAAGSMAIAVLATKAMFSDSDGKTKSTKDKAAKPKAAPQEAAMAEPEGERPHGIGDLASLVSGGTYGKTVGEMGELYRDAKRPRL